MSGSPERTRVVNIGGRGDTLTQQMIRLEYLVIREQRKYRREYRPGKGPENVRSRVRPVDQEPGKGLNTGPTTQLNAAPEWTHRDERARQRMAESCITRPCGDRALE